uniref:Uncharacterized protein n=1 Tax=Oryza nivara TaxID=4536 RepID=A0A0E0HX91_ORYNI
MATALWRRSPTRLRQSSVVEDGMRCGVAPWLRWCSVEDGSTRRDTEAAAVAQGGEERSAIWTEIRGSFTREVFLFTVAIGIFLALAALTKVITNGWPMVCRTLLAPFSVCVIILLAAGAIAATTMSNHPTLHFLSKVAARVSLIFGIMILEVPFIQMAAGLSAHVFAPIFMMATLVVLGYIWWRSEPDVVRALYSPFCSCFLRSHRQVQVTPQAADYNV